MIDGQRCLLILQRPCFILEIKLEFLAKEEKLYKELQSA